ncbi:flagellar basal-body rod protein FlgF [Pseudobdellovibrio exovorus]|uniref:Flagellar biosynthesisprotein n=1 Tax=Pseudobdellovibrio exovorus JSS TaxID=1184267 RepID=M4V6F3_9BACT|nr:flagellar basal-body rod protein FlgF [Pseudobdellovibrio exovorus]AGH94783.1 flagellar biosynthesisprotein [Pseudobdellovibrio exovorus JSS]
MSTKGIFTALSGALAQTQKIDTIANNIANVNTTGFKRDQQTFGEYLTAFEKEPQVIQVPRVPASIESFYDMNGGDKAFVNSTGTYTNFEQGSLKHTGGKLDVAIDGAGFFEVMTPSGVQITRAGNFTLDGDGQLVTKDGFPVLMDAADDTPPEDRIMRFTGQGQPSISDAGEVFDGAQNLGRLSLIQVSNPDSLLKVGSNNYTFKPELPSEVTRVATPNLKQGFLETSNVNIVQEMTEMISAQRVFEGTQKAISAYDSMADKSINVIGNTKG